MTRHITASKGKTSQRKSFKYNNLRFSFHVCGRSAVDKKKPLHARAPGFDSRQWNSMAVLFCSFSFLTSFFYLLAGFILFIVLPLYNFARCWVKRILYLRIRALRRE